MRSGGWGTPGTLAWRWPCFNWAAWAEFALHRRKTHWRPYVCGPAAWPTALLSQRTLTPQSRSKSCSASARSRRTWPSRLRMTDGHPLRFSVWLCHPIKRAKSSCNTLTPLPEQLSRLPWPRSAEPEGGAPGLQVEPARASPDCGPGGGLCSKLESGDHENTRASPGECRAVASLACAGVRSFQAWSEKRAGRPPRSESALLSSLFAEEEATVDMAKMSASKLAVMNSQSMFNYGLVIAGACHLYVVRQFSAKFNEHAFGPLFDDGLRNPNLQEIVAADCNCWLTIFSTRRDKQCSLNQEFMRRQ